jgi:site-specific DNA-cytosine methylase
MDYYMYYTTIQLSQLNVPQYRERLWCFPIRKDAADAIGGIPLLQPKATESPRIGDFIKQNSNYYNTIGPATMIERDNDQVHHEFKPHLKG